MSQVQCPNCGGYKVSTETATIDKKTGRQYSFGCYFWLCILIGLLGFLPLMDQVAIVVG